MTKLKLAMAAGVAAVLAFGVAACGNTDEATETETPPAAEGASDTTTPPADTMPPADPAATPPADGTATPPAETPPAQ